MHGTLAALGFQRAMLEAHKPKVCARCSHPYLPHGNLLYSRCTRPRCKCPGWLEPK